MINAFSLNKLLNKMISCQHLSRLFLFIPFDLLAPKEFRFIWYSNFLTLSVPDESYSRNVSCALNMKSTSLFFFINNACHNLLYIILNG
jgi:hypothetical protein